MKTFILSAILSLILLGACQKEELSPVMNETSSIHDSIQPRAGTTIGYIGYNVSPQFGRPNSTYYYFKIYDVSGSLSLSVKIYDKASGTTTYYPMIRNGNYWTLSKKISTNGWYDYRYVYTSNHATINSTTYQSLCNTKNGFNTSPYLIGWPFGADGSSWSNRNTWNGGQEGGSGYGWNEGSHTGTTERYSDDWNKTNDLGAIIRSPLDGYIETVGTYTVPGYNTPSKYVSIIQQGSDGKLYRFYVSHLQTTASGLCYGKYVRAGIDQIGTLGSTGASSPHAHTNMRINDISVPFYFAAQ